MTTTLPGSTERLPARDGDLCEVCKGRTEQMYLKHIYIGHKQCLERTDLDEQAISQNIIDNNRTYKARAAA